ncbi:MAG TPA: multidrug effflux MFS transporter [Stellaceae bacterium]|jgi:DHA1 family bicyclomycin/chloramphenicol resistance-like MFS transporter
MLNPHGRPFRVLLGAQSMVSSLAVDMSLPALPAIAAGFDTSAARAQLTIGFYLLGYASGQLFYGPLSDRFGRRPMLLIGMTIYAASGFLCAFAPTIGIMIAVRLLQGFGGAVGVVVTRAAARDHFHGSQLAQMMSSITAVQAFGPLLAPVLGGILATHLRWQAIFLVQGTFAAAMLLATWSGFGESLSQRDPHAIRPARLLANYLTFFSNPRCIGFALVSACVFSGLFIVLSASPFVLIDVYGVSSQAYGFFFGISVLGYMVGSFGNRRLLRQGAASERLLRYGLVILIAAAMAMLLFASSRWGGVPGIMGPYVTYCFAISLVQSNAVAAAMEPVPHMAGTGASLMGAIQMSSAAAGGFIVDLFFDGTGTPMGVGMASAAIAATAFYWLIARHHAKPA